MKNCDSPISSKVRWYVNLISISAMISLYLLDYFNWMGEGIRDSIAYISTLMLLLMIWSWKDYLQISKLGPSGVETSTLKYSIPTESNPVELKDEEALEDNIKQNEMQIREAIMRGYEGSEGAITVENTASGLRIPKEYAKNALESLYKEGELYATTLPINNSERMYIHKSNEINKKIDKAVKMLMMKHNELLHQYKFFSIDQYKIDALIETNNNFYIIHILRINEDLDNQIEKAESIRLDVIDALTNISNKPVRYCIAFDNTKYARRNIKTRSHIALVRLED